ncbi:MAG: amino acid adenylation domain-containing protein [Calditrichaeota bacterium]|nr:MAG: amino acid adenylation domain-containing protein [Calditrichota bacterium]
MSNNFKDISKLTPEEKRARLAELLKEKANKRLVYPLSFAQQRLWFLDQLEPGNSAYNIPAAFRLKGKLNIQALEKSIIEIQRRHKVFQTQFIAENGKPVQVINPEIFAKPSIIELQNLPESRRMNELQPLMQEQIQQPFDLSKGPLLRITLFHLDKEDHVLLLVMHHIIADGWSVGIFIQEMATLYQIFLDNSNDLPVEGVLPELKLQYGEFAVWQREWLQGERLTKQMNYWKQQLADVPVLELPTDYPRPVLQTYRGRRERIELSPELTASIKKLSLAEGATVYMTLLTTFMCLLYRYSGQEDISVGTPIANRHYENIENLIGFFVNTLVLRAHLKGNLTFQQLLSRVRQTTLAAYDHQDLPFEMLVDTLHPKRSLNRTPLFQVMFSLQNTPSQSISLPELELENIDVYNGKAKFDLTVYMWEEANKLCGVFEYNADLFKASSIKRMIQHFKNLLGGVVSQPNQKISAQPLLSSNERSQLLSEWDGGVAREEEFRSFPEVFEEVALREPDRVAVEVDGERLSYGELNARSNCLAGYLRGLGVGPEVLVGVYMERSLELLVALLGVLKSGGAYVPLDPSYPRERLSYMIEDSGLGVILTQESLVGEVPSEGVLVVSVDGRWAEISKAGFGGIEGGVDGRNLAYVIYTSGSTGRPKGVGVEHRSLMNFLEAMREEPGLGREDRVLAVTTLSFDISALELYLPLLVGGRVVLAGREVARDGRRLGELISRRGVTVMQGTPATWRLLLGSGWLGDGRLKMLCGGEALSRDLAVQLLGLGGELWNMYGPTEATVWCMVCRVEGLDEGEVYIGGPVRNLRYYVLDGNLEPVPVGVCGELYIGGLGLARGYLGRGDLTAERFLPDPFSGEAGDRMYRTGDLVRYCGGGRLEYLGRLDHQVKVRGFRIELGEIEACLRGHRGVRDAVVLVQEVGGERQLVGYVVCGGGAVPSVSELRSYLGGYLPEYMVPNSYVYLDALPLTPNGKVDRGSLPLPGGARPELSTSYVAPQNEVERVIAEIWQGVLGVEEVGIEDNFFDLGGHSLLLVQVQNKLQEHFKRDIPIIDLFKYPTVHALAKYFIDEDGESVTYQKIREQAQRQKQALAQHKKLKEVLKNDR